MTYKTKNYRWTEDAIYCLNRGCKCSGCFFEKYFTPADGRYREPVTKCKMKETVILLKQKIGNPKGYNEKTIIKDKKNDN